MDFDVYIVIKDSDWYVAEKNIPYIKKNIRPRNIYIISGKSLEQKLGAESGCKFLDENSIFQGMSFSAVKNYLLGLGSIPENAGWYLQQFIKLSLAYICKEEYYLVWDADTIPLNYIPFFDARGKPYFNMKREYFKAYYKPIKNLFGYEKKTAASFVSEHMIFNVDVTRQMLKKIEDNPDYDGTNFWQKILQASDLLSEDLVKKDQRYFSEFETYGTYTDYNCPKMYARRKLRTLRCGADLLGTNPDDRLLDWAAKDFDTISFEIWAKPLPEVERLKNPEYMERYTCAQYIRQILDERRKEGIKAVLRGDKVAFKSYQLFRRQITKFDFFFFKKVNYKKQRNIFYRIFRKIVLTLARMDNEPRIA